ncbi:MAG: hypothetical protein NUV91_08330, partial [Candidatus Omnitrophica bacterium]|nr:hypothetical protein [Candidatus Omnitrophota bacterium]
VEEGRKPLYEENQALQNQLKEVKNLFPKKVEEAKAPLNQRIAELQKELTQAQDSVSAKDKNIAGLIENEKKWKSEMETLRQEKETFTQSVGALKEELQNVKASIPQQIAQAKKPVEEQSVQLASQLRATQEEAQNQKKQNETQISSLQKEIQNHQAALQKKEDRIAQLNKEIERATLTLSAAQQENVFLNGEVDKLKAQVESVQAVLKKDFLNKKTELDRKVNVLTQAADQKDALIKNQESKIADLSKEAKDMSEDYFSLLDEKAELEERVQQLEKSKN